MPIHRRNETMMSKSSLEKEAHGYSGDNNDEPGDMYPMDTVRSPRSESTSLGVEDGDDDRQHHTQQQQYHSHQKHQQQEEYNQFINDEYPPSHHYQQRGGAATHSGGRGGDESPAFLELYSGDVLGVDDNDDGDQEGGGNKCNNNNNSMMKRSELSGSVQIVEAHRNFQGGQKEQQPSDKNVSSAKKDVVSATPQQHDDDDDTAAMSLSASVLPDEVFDDCDDWHYHSRATATADDGCCDCATYACIHTRLFPYRPVPTTSTTAPPIGSVKGGEGGVGTHNASSTTTPSVVCSSLSAGTTTTNTVFHPTQTSSSSSQHQEHLVKFSGCGSQFGRGVVEEAATSKRKWNVLGIWEVSILRWIALSCIGRGFGGRPDDNGEQQIEAQQSNQQQQDADPDSPKSPKSPSVATTSSPHRSPRGLRGSPRRGGDQNEDQEEQLQVLPKVSLCTLVVSFLLMLVMATEGVLLAASGISRAWVKATLIPNLTTDKLVNPASTGINTTYLNTTKHPSDEFTFGLFSVCRGSRCGDKSPFFLLRESRCSNLLTTFNSLSSIEQSELMEPDIWSNGLLFLIGLGLVLLLVSILASCGTIYKLAKSRSALRSLEADPLNTLITYEQKKLLPGFKHLLRRIKAKNEAELAHAQAKMGSFLGQLSPASLSTSNTTTTNNTTTIMPVNLQKASLSGYVFPFAAMAGPKSFSYDPLDMFEPDLIASSSSSSPFSNPAKSSSSAVLSSPTTTSTTIHSLEGEAPSEARLCAGVATRVNHYLNKFVGTRHPYMVRAVLFVLPISSTLILACTALSLLTFYNLEKAGHNDVFGGLASSSTGPEGGIGCIAAEAKLRLPSPRYSSCEMMAIAFPFDIYHCTFDRGAYLLLAGAGASLLVFITSVIFAFSVAGDLWEIYFALDLPTVWWSSLVNDVHSSHIRLPSTASKTSTKRNDDVDEASGSINKNQKHSRPISALSSTSLRLGHLHRSAVVQFIHPCVCHLHTREVLLAERRRHENVTISSNIQNNNTTTIHVGGGSAVGLGNSGTCGDADDLNNSVDCTSVSETGYARFAIIYGLIRIALALNPATASAATAENHARQRRLGEKLLTSPVPLSLCTGCGGLDIIANPPTTTTNSTAKAYPVESNHHHRLQSPVSTRTTNPLLSTSQQQRQGGEGGDKVSNGVVSSSISVSSSTPLEEYRLTSQGSIVKTTRSGVSSDNSVCFNPDDIIVPYLRVPQVVSIPGFVFPSSSFASTTTHHQRPTLRSSLGVDLSSVPDNNSGDGKQQSTRTHSNTGGGSVGVAIYLRRSFKTLDSNLLHRGSEHSSDGGVVDPHEHTAGPATAPHRGFNNVRGGSGSDTERIATRQRSVAFSTDEYKTAANFSNDTHKVDVPPANNNNNNGYRPPSQLSGLLPIIPLSHEEVVLAITANTGSVAHHQLKDRTAISARAEEMNVKSHDDVNIKGLSSSSFESLGRSSGGGRSPSNNNNNDSPPLGSSIDSPKVISGKPVKRGQRRYSLIRTANANGWMGGSDIQGGGSLPPARSPRSVVMLDNSSSPLDVSNQQLPQFITQNQQQQAPPPPQHNSNNSSSLRPPAITNNLNSKTPNGSSHNLSRKSTLASLSGFSRPGLTHDPTVVFARPTVTEPNPSSSHNANNSSIISQSASQPTFGDFQSSINIRPQPNQYEEVDDEDALTVTDAVD